MSAGTRRTAHVVSYETGPDGQVRAYSVKCPYCRGRHAHAASRATDHAHPYCGAFSGYEVVWPTPVANETPALEAEAEENIDMLAVAQGAS